MKRITYISRFARDLSREEINALGETAQRNNEREGITGVLICSGGVFFQIIEGDEDPIDRLYARICCDPRHVEIVCLKVELDVREREFPDWSMQMFNLDETTDVLMHPIRSLFQVLTESQGILEKYTQPTILKFIHSGVNPLRVPPRREEKAILFCDMVASSLFSTALSVEEMLALVNRYSTVCTEIISERGGEVTKFIGDCVMAYFSRDQVDEAIQSGLEILAALEKLRKGAPPDSPVQVLYCGVGIACGEVIEGNIGSNIKMEYTVLGESVNQAAYLEKLTRNLPRALVFSPTVKSLASGRWTMLHLGNYPLKPGQLPTPVFSIDDPVTFKPFSSAQVISRIISILEHIAIRRSRVGSRSNKNGRP